MDGRLITEERTAAVSAVATRLLARPEAAVLALIGSGVQARSHLTALRLVRTFREVGSGARARPGEDETPNRGPPPQAARRSHPEDDRWTTRTSSTSAGARWRRSP